MGILRWILALPIILGTVFFALAHPEATKITLTPFHEAITFPLYFIVISFLVIGFFLGALIAWIGMFPSWREKRHLKKEVAKLTKELNKSNEKFMKELSKEKTEPNNILPAIEE